MSGLALLNVYSVGGSRVMGIARAGEQLSEASGPAAVRYATAVRELGGGAIDAFRTSRSDAAYGYTTRNSTSCGVAADGSGGLHRCEAAVGTWDSSKSAVDSAVQHLSLIHI